MPYYFTLWQKTCTHPSFNCSLSILLTTVPMCSRKKTISSYSLWSCALMNILHWENNSLYSFQKSSFISLRIIMDFIMKLVFFQQQGRAQIKSWFDLIWMQNFDELIWFDLIWTIFQIWVQIKSNQFKSNQPIFQNFWTVEGNFSVDFFCTFWKKERKPPSIQPKRRFLSLLSKIFLKNN